MAHPSKSKTSFHVPATNSISRRTQPEMGTALAVAAVSKNAESAAPVAILLGMVFMFLGELWFPVPKTSVLLAPVIKAIPSTYVTHALREVGLSGASLGSVWPDLAVLGTWAALTLVFATWRFGVFQEPA